MISRNILQKAVNKNIINADQLEPLYQFLNTDDLEQIVESREEPLKFIRSFGDVFITLGVILLAVSINMANLAGYYAVIPVIGFVLVAEWLVRVRRLALPGIAILLSILFFVNEAIVLDNETTTVSSLAIISLTSFLFYLRYKMPFSLLPLSAASVAIGINQVGLDTLKTPIIFAGFGLMVFIVALWFDTKDTKRISHLSDSAFWLHLLAAPLIVHGAMVTMLVSEQPLFSSLAKEVFIFVFFAAFFMLALFIDRRAMLISTQLYVIYALTQILQDNMNSAQDVMIYILIVLGLFVIYFGAYWYKTRRFIFGFLSESKIGRYVPDFDITDIKN